MTAKLDKVKSRILVVDDESSVRDILRDFLVYEGYDVELAEDGHRGLELLLSQPIDVIITDLEMPGMNGLELLSETRKLKNAPPVIMMTGYGTVETAIEAMKSGAFDYILKPFQIEELAHLVQKTLEHKKLEAENLRLHELVSLYQVSERLNNAGSREDIARILTDAACVELQPDIFCFWELTSGQWEKVGTFVRDGLPDGAETFVDSFDTLALLKNFHDDHPVQPAPNDIAEFFHAESPRPQSVMMVPMRAGGRVSGMLGAFMFSNGHRFVEGNRRSLQIYADRAAICLENVRLQDNLQQTFMQTINSLVGALEAKDEYTRGHSERVMQWAMIIGKLYNLSDQALGDLRRAALLHDIGKIGLNLDALNKPEKLTSEEIENFKLHTVIGKRILEPVDFLHGSIPAVTHHHERWDGSGYPLGLARKEIPLGARVLAIADSFEVMITDRVYRAALTLDEAKAELTRSAESHFDPEIVAAFLTWLDQFKTTDELPVKGGRRDSSDQVAELKPRGPKTKPAIQAQKSAENVA